MYSLRKFFVTKRINESNLRINNGNIYKFIFTFKFNNAIIDVEVYKNKEDYQRSDSIKEEQTFNQYLDNLNNYTIDSHDPGLESGDKLIYLPDCSLNTLYLRSNISEELFGDLHNSEDTIISQNLSKSSLTKLFISIKPVKYLIGVNLGANI